MFVAGYCLSRTLTTTSSLAAMVLIPSQNKFEQTNPGISVEISTGESVDNQSYIIPIRFGDAAIVDPSNVIKSESFNVFGASGMTPPSWSNESITLFTTEWKNKALPDAPLEAWLAMNGLEGSNINLKKFDQELFGIHQAISENGLVFCSTTLTKRLLNANLLQQFGTQPVKSDLCYYVPNKRSFETRSAVRFLDWVEGLLSP
ncbi:hypothetical protein [Idiomarina loihiensis]|uniref:hypothetical protein n=1 Tax=Idiomarina loihiensis TaxID=135577 RepID=UPI00384CACE7